MSVLFVDRLDGLETEIDMQTIESLKTELRGNLITEGEEGYDDARELWNAINILTSAIIILILFFTIPSSRIRSTK